MAAKISDTIRTVGRTRGDAIPVRKPQSWLEEVAGHNLHHE